jgi:hypothetical protein
MAYINIAKQTDTLGSDRYRDEITSVPLAYRPTITHTIQQNGSGSSNSVIVRASAPSLTVVNGITTSTDTFLATSKFTALQQITDNVTRAKAYDDHIRFLIATRATNLNGQLPSTALPSKWQTYDVAAAAAAMV